MCNWNNMEFLRKGNLPVVRLGRILSTGCHRVHGQVSTRAESGNESFLTAGKQILVSPWESRGGNQGPTTRKMTRMLNIALNLQAAQAFILINIDKYDIKHEKNKSGNLEYNKLTLIQITKN